MKKTITTLILVLALSPFSLALQVMDSNSPPTSTHPDLRFEKPSPGTVSTKQHVNPEAQPASKQVGTTPEIIRAAQAKLNDKGYKAGPPTGRMNAKTFRAIIRFQRATQLTVTGKLDESTLSHLNIAP